MVSGAHHCLDHAKRFPVCYTLKVLKDKYAPKETWRKDMALKKYIFWLHLDYRSKTKMVVLGKDIKINRLFTQDC